MPVKKYQAPTKRLKTSESPVRPKAEPVVNPTKLSKNKGWQALQVHNENIREKLKGSWNTLSGSIMDWVLETDKDGNQFRLKELLAETKLKDIGVMLGIATEKVLLLDGQPTQIVATAEQKKLDELLPALMNEVKRRGASVELTERKAEIKVPPTTHA